MRRVRRAIGLRGPRSSRRLTPSAEKQRSLPPPLVAFLLLAHLAVVPERSLCGARRVRASDVRAACRCRRVRSPSTALPPVAAQLASSTSGASKGRAAQRSSLELTLRREARPGPVRVRRRHGSKARCSLPLGYQLRACPTVVPSRRVSSSNSGLGAGGGGSVFARQAVAIAALVDLVVALRGCRRL